MHIDTCNAVCLRVHALERYLDKPKLVPSSVFWVPASPYLIHGYDGHPATNKPSTQPSGSLQLHVYLWFFLLSKPLQHVNSITLIAICISVAYCHRNYFATVASKENIVFVFLLIICIIKKSSIAKLKSSGWLFQIPMQIIFDLTRRRQTHSHWNSKSKERKLMRLQNIWISGTKWKKEG